VFTANYNGLSAALSKLGEPELPHGISSLRAYEAVVESFYRRLTVIPLRYGCRVGCPYDVINLLRENHDAYDALLREFEGLAERGHLLSLHFLVPRDSVEGFRRAADHLPSNQPFKLLFSGPWPPYNFVDSLQP
jgi:hypothetical protein